MEIVIKNDEGEEKLHVPKPSSGYGETTIVWQDGQVLDVIVQERIRVKK